MIRSFAFNLYFYALTLLAALIGIVLVPIPTPVLLRGLLHSLGARRRLGHALDRRHEGRGPRPREYLPTQGPALLANKHHSESRRHPACRPDPRHRLRRHAGAVPHSR